MPEEQEAPQQAKPKSDWFGGSIFLKIVFILGLLIIAFVIIFGFILKQFNIMDLIVNLIFIIIGASFIFFAFKGVMAYFKPKPFSPTEDFRTKIVRMAVKVKPINVYDLWLRGEDMRSKAIIGKIEGVGYIPYLSQVPKRNKEGSIVYEKNKDGTLIEEEYRDVETGETKKRPIPVYEFLTEKDGDIVFVVPRYRGIMGIIKREIDIIRVNPKFVSDILGDIFIKDVNLVPYGEYLYPAKQWQKDIIRIQLQHQSEAIIQTHRNWLDLVSNVTQMSLEASPEFQKIMMAQSERLSSIQMGAG